MGRGGPDRKSEQYVSPMDRIVVSASGISLDNPPPFANGRREFTVAQEHFDLLAYLLYLRRTGGNRKSTPQEKEEDALRARFFLQSRNFSFGQFEVLDEEVRSRRRGDNGRHSDTTTRRFLATSPREFDWDDM